MTEFKNPEDIDVLERLRLRKEARRFPSGRPECKVVPSPYPAPRYRTSEERAADEAAEIQKKVDERDRQWAELVGKKYAAPFDINRLTARNRESHAKAMTWLEGTREKGLRLVGPTRAGKTRTAAMILRALAHEGKSIHRVEGVMFSMQASNAFFNVESSDSWILKMCRCRVLFIDDLAKRLTDPSATALHAILEEMWRHEKTVIITTNFTTKMIEQSLPDDGQLAASLNARLKEYMDVVHFT